MERNFDQEQHDWEDVEAIIHPKGMDCPHCGSRRVHRTRRAPRELTVTVRGTKYKGITTIPRWHCRNCERDFSGLTGTAMQNIKVRPHKILAYLRSKVDMTPTEIQKKYKLGSRETAEKMWMAKAIAGR